MPFIDFITLFQVFSLCIPRLTPLTESGPTDRRLAFCLLSDGKETTTAKTPEKHSSQSHSSRTEPYLFLLLISFTSRRRSKSQETWWTLGGSHR